MDELERIWTELGRLRQLMAETTHEAAFKRLRGMIGELEERLAKLETVRRSSPP